MSLSCVNGMREKVLIVEDEALIALSLRESLTLVGYEVVGVAATVRDALTLAENTRPDLALFDVRLAGRRDGIEGAILVRAMLDIPVVFLTAQSDEGTRVRARAADPAAYLSKPVHAQQIIAAVQGALSTRT
jgi:two-component system, response regulator PdtaR